MGQRKEEYEHRRYMRNYFLLVSFVILPILTMDM
jgi:hypothetical protein